MIYSSILLAYWVSFCCITLVLSLSNIKVLNTQQMNQIRSWISNKQLNTEQRFRVNNVLITYYQKRAHKQAILFKKNHKYKCRNISLNDLKSASEIGLIKASEKYNGKSSFYYYSGLHIHYELLKVLTNHNKISQISQKNLRNGFSQTNPKFNVSTFHNLQNKLNILYYSPISNQFSRIYKYKEQDKQLWFNVFSILPTPLMKKIFLLKYDVDFKKIRNDKQISEIVGRPIGNIRLTLKIMKKIIYAKIILQ